MVKQLICRMQSLLLNKDGHKRIVFIFLMTFMFLVSASEAADFAVAPPEQIVSESQYSNALKKDPWEKGRWNYIDLKRACVMKVLLKGTDGIHITDGIFMTAKGMGE